MKRLAISAIALSLAALLAAAWAAPSPAQGGSAGLLDEDVARHPAVLQTCADAPRLEGSLPFVQAGNTTGHDDDYNLGAAGLCAGNGGLNQYPLTGLGSDFPWAVSPDMECPLIVSLVPGAGVDLALYVLRPDCSDVAGQCVIVDDAGAAGVEEQVEFLAAAYEDYVIIVDGYDGSSGPYNLEIASPEPCQLIDPHVRVLTGSVWEDLNENGIWESPDEPLLGESLRVDLYTCGGEFVDWTWSEDALDRQYHFYDLVPGGYYVEFELPPGYSFSPQHQGGDPTADSDLDPLTGQTPCLSLAAGEERTDIDAGMHEATSFDMGDRAWYDTDQDGIQDIGEQGAAGIAVKLFDNEACYGEHVREDITDSSGAYGFSDLPSGIYCLDFFDNLPSSWSFSPQDQGEDDAVDSDVDEATGQVVNIVLSADDQRQDAGFFVPGSIGDQVWCDANGNSSFDPGEGLNDVDVHLFEDPACDGTGGGWMGGKRTSGDGDYLHDGLPTGPPGGPPVCYLVRVDLGDLGSCAIPAAPVEYSVFLYANESNYLHADFGFREPPSDLTLGDFVWYDTYSEGVQNAGEPGVSGVGVELFDNGLCAGSAIATDLTDATGNYGFSGLTAGTYCLSFWGGLPPGWEFSPSGLGSDALDSDPFEVNGLVYTITLTADDLTQDAGMFAASIIGSQVWCDANGNSSLDAGEAVDGVTVDLYDDSNCDGVPGGWMYADDTAAGGQYDFRVPYTGPPGGPPVCYVAEVDTGDMGTCSESITPVR